MINALGRRKSAIARIYVTEGTGKITINKRDLTEYFPSPILQFVVKQPLTLLDVAEKYDIKVTLCGGGFMTRDPRAVERKKPGQPKARRRFQFSKR